jgi:uncharacterized GH25 family protein
MKSFLSAIMIFLFCFTGSNLHAHCLWLNLENDQPEVGQTVKIEIGWGHKFPKDEVIKEGLLDEIYALNSTGERYPVRQVSPTIYEFSPRDKGVYTLLASIHPGFLSKTTEGYRLKPKKGLKGVISCFRFDMRAKSLINVGGVENECHGRTGDNLEIVPLKNPKEVKVNELFPVKVIFQGKALSNAEVKATYAGFSNQPSTYAFHTKTDGEGVARIKILKGGHWFVNVLHEIPYPDPDECDQIRYNYCFTFCID